MLRSRTATPVTTAPPQTVRSVQAWMAHARGRRRQLTILQRSVPVLEQWEAATQTLPSAPPATVEDERVAGTAAQSALWAWQAQERLAAVAARVPAHLRAQWGRQWRVQRQATLAAKAAAREALGADALNGVLQGAHLVPSQLRQLYRRLSLAARERWWPDRMTLDRPRLGGVVTLRDVLNTGVAAGVGLLAGQLALPLLTDYSGGVAGMALKTAGIHLAAAGTVRAQWLNTVQVFLLTRRTLALWQSSTKAHVRVPLAAGVHVVGLLVRGNVSAAVVQAILGSTNPATVAQYLGYLSVRVVGILVGQLASQVTTGGVVQLVNTVLHYDMRAADLHDEEKLAQAESAREVEYLTRRMVRDGLSYEEAVAQWQRWRASGPWFQSLSEAMTFGTVLTSVTMMQLWAVSSGSSSTVSTVAQEMAVAVAVQPVVARWLTLEPLLRWAARAALAGLRHASLATTGADVTQASLADWVSPATREAWERWQVFRVMLHLTTEQALTGALTAAGRVVSEDLMANWYLDPLGPVQALVRAWHNASGASPTASPWVATVLHRLDVLARARERSPDEARQAAWDVNVAIAAALDRAPLSIRDAWVLWGAIQHLDPPDTTPGPDVRAPGAPQTRPPRVPDADPETRAQTVNPDLAWAAQVAARPELGAAELRWRLTHVPVQATMQVAETVASGAAWGAQTVWNSVQTWNPWSEQWAQAARLTRAQALHAQGAASLKAATQAAWGADTLQNLQDMEHLVGRVKALQSFWDQFPGNPAAAAEAAGLQAAWGAQLQALQELQQHVTRATGALESLVGPQASAPGTAEAAEVAIQTMKQSLARWQVLPGRLDADLLKDQERQVQTWEAGVEASVAKVTPETLKAGVAWWDASIDTAASRYRSAVARLEAATEAAHDTWKAWKDVPDTPLADDAHTAHQTLSTTLQRWKRWLGDVHNVQATLRRVQADIPGASGPRLKVLTRMLNEAIDKLQLRRNGFDGPSRHDAPHQGPTGVRVSDLHTWDEKVHQLRAQSQLMWAQLRTRMKDAVDSSQRMWTTEARPRRAQLQATLLHIERVRHRLHQAAPQAPGLGDLENMLRDQLAAWDQLEAQMQAHAEASLIAGGALSAADPSIGGTGPDPRALHAALANLVQATETLQRTLENNPMLTPAQQDRLRQADADANIKADAGAAGPGTADPAATSKTEAGTGPDHDPGAGPQASTATATWMAWRHLLTSRLSAPWTEAQQTLLAAVRYYKLLEHQEHATTWATLATATSWDAASGIKGLDAACQALRQQMLQDLPEDAVNDFWGIHPGRVHLSALGHAVESAMDITNPTAPNVIPAGVAALTKKLPELLASPASWAAHILTQRQWVKQPPVELAIEFITRLAARKLNAPAPGVPTSDADDVKRIREAWLARQSRAATATSTLTRTAIENSGLAYRGGDILHLAFRDLARGLDVTLMDTIKRSLSGTQTTWDYVALPVHIVQWLATADSIRVMMYGHDLTGTIHILAAPARAARDSITEMATAGWQGRWADAVVLSLPWAAGSLVAAAVPGHFAQVKMTLVASTVAMLAADVATGVSTAAGWLNS